jgi:hypothetical protein
VAEVQFAAEYRAIVSYPHGRHKVDRDRALMILAKGPDGVREWNNLRARMLDLPSLRGVSLRGLNLTQADTLLRARQAKSVIEELSRKLSEAHAVNIVHRDITPANILFGCNRFAYKGAISLTRGQ